MWGGRGGSRLCTSGGGPLSRLDVDDSRATGDGKEKGSAAFMGEVGGSGKGEE